VKIHEYQAKELFKKYSVPVPQGGVAFNADEAVAVAKKLAGYPVVVKAQIHAGGRGKGGGVKLAQSAEEVQSVAREIIGMNLVTHQTGKEGRLVKKVLVEQGLNIDKELYLSIIPDRASAQIVVMASEAGGMDIEAVAAKTPQRIIKVFINPLLGMQPYHCRVVAFGLNLSPAVMKPFVAMLKNLYRLFVDYDCSLAEINPLVITAEEAVLALDAKVNFDDNALFRHPDIQEYRDIAEEDPLEVEASKFKLNYINLGGNVGNMVNGAGLAMATMDIIKYYGGEPANFLDVGGGTSEERVKEAFKILLGDPNTQGVFVNIFGGIVRTDLVARGIVNAIKGMDVKVPIVIRLVGTNEEEGRRIIEESGMNFIADTSLPAAAQKVVELCKS